MMAVGMPVGNRDAFHARLPNLSAVRTDFRPNEGAAESLASLPITRDTGLAIREIDSRNSAVGTSSLTVVTVNSNANQFPFPRCQLRFFAVRILPDFAP